MYDHDLTRQRETQRAGGRSFGFVFSLCFAGIGVWPALAGAPARGWALAIALVLGALALGTPRILAPLGRAWATVGLLLGAAVSPLVLGAIFFFVVTPTAIVMRLLGNDHFRLRRDPEAKTYWVARPPGESTGKSFPRQF